MSKQLVDKVAVVTGASDGIGRATAMRLIDEGARVVLLARTQSVLEKVAADLGDRALPIACDVADPEQVRAAFSEVAKLTDQIDIVANVAGLGGAGAIEHFTDADIQLLVGANLLGPIYVTREAIPFLRRAGGGDIVNVCSEATLQPSPLLALYGTTKGALEHFSRAAHSELKADQIRVTLFMAGRTDTNFGQRAFTSGPALTEEQLDELMEHAARQSGLEKMNPEWVADSILYVVTRPAGQMIDLIRVRSSSAQIS